MKKHLYPIQVCPVWSDRSACSASCGDGIKMRSRTCIGGVAGMAGCTGPVNEQEACKERVSLFLVVAIFENFNLRMSLYICLILKTQF